MALAAGVAGAGGASGVAVDAYLEAHFMELVGEGLDAVGKFFRVGDEIAFGIAIA